MNDLIKKEIKNQTAINDDLNQLNNLTAQIKDIVGDIQTLKVNYLMIIHLNMF